MRWVLGIAGPLVLLVLIACVIGYTLPKAHVASASVRLAAPPDSIWTSLTDVAAFPTWRPGLSRVEVLPDANGQRGWREFAKHDAVSYGVVESSPPGGLVTRIADPNLPYGGTWTYDLIPDESGTRLTITENGEVYNPIFRFVSRFIMGHTSMMEAVLRALGTKHGETVTPVPAGTAT